jgi:hypothetical protein
VNFRNNPGTGNHMYYGQDQHRQGNPAKSFGAKSSGFPVAGAGELPAAPVQDILPAVIPEAANLNLDTAAQPAETNKASGFSLASLGEIKGFVDRIGGIDGILTTVTKVQKVVSSVSQMAPLVKVILSSFGKKSADSDDDDIGETRPKRKRRRKAGSGRRKPVKRRR